MRVCRWLSHHSVPVTSHCHIIKAGCFGNKQVLLYLQMPYIPHHHHQFVVFPKRVSVHTFYVWRTWRNPITLHSDIYVCSLPVGHHRHIRQKALNWIAIMCSRLLIMYPTISSTTFFRTGWRSYLLLPLLRQKSYYLTQPEQIASQGASGAFFQNDVNWYRARDLMSFHFSMLCLSEKDLNSLHSLVWNVFLLFVSLSVELVWNEVPVQVIPDGHGSGL